MSASNPASDGAAGKQYPLAKPEADWREQLSPAEYLVLRESGTEPAFSGEYVEPAAQGEYSCRACGELLFAATAQFESHCGWPSFFTPLAGDKVELIEDRSLGAVRIEVRCANCGSHLGHVFEGEGYDTPTDQRWCINSISISLQAR